MGKLDGKVAVITGATSGMALASAKLFVDEGAYDQFVAEVLVKAQALDQTEHSMYGYIEKLRSLEEAVQRFGRL